jgi:hypothetical protein
MYYIPFFGQNQALTGVCRICLIVSVVLGCFVVGWAFAVLPGLLFWLSLLSGVYRLGLAAPFSFDGLRAMGGNG